MLKHLARHLRRPATIVAEIAALAAAFVLSTVVAQGPRAPADGVPSTSGPSPLAERLSNALGLEHVFTTPWFLALVVLALSSLSLVVRDQITRGWRTWRRAPSPEALRGAPFRREGVFPRRDRSGLPRPVVRVRGALGAFGSPAFHLGVLIVVLAGLVRALWGADAVVDLMVGETLLSVPSQYAAQRPGILARAFAYPEPVAFEGLRVVRYPSGETKSVEGTVRTGEDARAVRRTIGINAPLRAGTHSLYIRSTGGAAALVEVHGNGRVERHAILLREMPAGSAGQAVLGDGTLLRLSSNEGGIGRTSGRLDLRAIRDGALAASVALDPGRVAVLPGGTEVLLMDVVPWVQFSGQRDVSTPFVYAGFFLASLGGFLMVAVVRVESAVVLEPAGDGVKVLVMMRPQRFVPLFEPSFEALWADSIEALARPAGEAG